MKLAKVSLAAVVALGTLSTASMAKDLSEAIQGVDVSGFLRYRFENKTEKNADFVKNDGGEKDSVHKWRAVSNFTIPTSETFSAVVGLEYNDNTKVGGQVDSTLDSGEVINGSSQQIDFAKNENQDISGEQGFAVRQFYGVWNPNGTKTTVQAGKFNLGTPVTSADVSRATGIMAMNSDVENVTFAAAALDSFHASGQLKNRENNIYALAALGGFGGFSGQLWGFNVEDMVDSLIAAQLGYEYDMFSVTGQYMHNNIKTVKTPNTDGYDDNNVPSDGYPASNGKGPIVDDAFEDTYAVWTIQGEINWSVLNATAGYMGSDTNGYFVQLDDDSAWLNYAGAQWYGSGFGAGGSNGSFGDSLSLKNDGKNEIEVWYLTAMVDTTWNNISVGADYVNAENNTKNLFSNTGTRLAGTEVNYEMDEWVARAEWKPTDAWKVKTYYSDLQTKQKVSNGNDGETQTNTKYRLEAKYSF